MMNKTARIFCSLLFVAFTFCFLFFLERDFIVSAIGYTMGKGEYVSYLAVVLLVVILWLLQKIVSRQSIMKKCPYAMSYLPSLILLPLVTHLFPKVNWIFVILALIVLLLWYVCLRILEKRQSTSGICENLFILLMGMIYVAVSANANDVQLYQLRMSSYLSEGKIDKALAVGKKSLATDNNLTNMRAYALNCKNAMGESLFEYPLPEGQIFLKPDFKMENAAEAQTDSVSRLDYVLCELLLQKKLNVFAQYVKSAVDTGKLSIERIPKHYREALILYNHLRMNPEWQYSDVQTEQNYRDYMDIYRSERKLAVRSNALHKLYGDTYWWYYHFHK